METVTVTETEKTQQMHSCYLCRKSVGADIAAVVPLTTGEKVYTHKGCLKLYVDKTANTTSACQGCSGNAGCC